MRDFNPDRLVPLDAFIYLRVVEAVWTRYRQEWAYGRRTRPRESVVDRPALSRLGPDPQILVRLEAALGSLPEQEHELIRDLYWENRYEHDLARDRGISQQAISKRKQ